MKSFSIALLFIFFGGILFPLAGCEKDQTEITEAELDPAETTVQQGYIVDISDSRILVVSDITKEEAVDLTQEKLLENDIGRFAAWYSVENTAPYEVGQLLRVEFEFMLESYPGQSEALRVQIVEEP